MRDLPTDTPMEDGRSLCSQTEIVNVFVLAPESVHNGPSRQHSTLDDVVTFVPLPVSGNSDDPHNCRPVLKEVVRNRICYPPPIRFRNNSMNAFAHEDVQAAETRNVHVMNMHKRWYASVDDTNTVKADRNTKIALAASRRMPVPMVKYSGDLVITGSLKTGFTVRGASRSACLYELRRQILHEFECGATLHVQNQAQDQDHGQDQKQKQNTPADDDIGGASSSTIGEINGGVVLTSVNIDAFLQKRKRFGQESERGDSPKRKKSSEENLQKSKSSAINLNAWKTAQEYAFLLQNNNPGLLLVHSQVCFLLLSSSCLI